MSLLAFSVSCDNNFDAPSAYGIGQYQGHPGIAYSNSQGSSQYVMPPDAADAGTVVVSDLVEGDAREGDVSKLDGEGIGCEEQYGADYCACEETETEDAFPKHPYCECKYLICVPQENQVQEMVEQYLTDCNYVAGDDPDLATDCANAHPD